MLDVLRKHASSWAIKVILGAIIISFAFFFGYTQMSKSGRGVGGLGSGKPVAKVNGMDISDAEFSFFFDRNLDRFKQTVKEGTIDESMRKFAQSLTLQQLIQRQLLLQTAREAGIEVSDQELVTVIRKNPELLRDGDFDPIFYRHQFLPYFENHYSINYEELVRQDLMINSLYSLFTPIQASSNDEKETLVWTFETTSLRPKKLIKENLFKDETELQEYIKSLVENPKKWKTLGKKAKLEIKTVGPISISERSKLLGGQGTLDDFKKIVTLNDSNPAVSIKGKDTVYLVHFVKMEILPTKKPVEQNEDFLAEWMRQQMANAKIQTYLTNE